MRDLTKYEVMKPNFSARLAEDLSTTHQIFEIEPLLQGYGHTLGNSMRRVLLSSLPGTAITAVRFSGADHQYSTVEGLSDDLLQVMLNLKQVIVKSVTDDEGTLKINVKGPKTVTAADIECSAGFEIVNPDQFIVDIVTDTTFEIEMKAATGTGYLTMTDTQTATIGEIMVDALFSPVVNVSYKVESTRVGRQTDYDKLILDVKTNGSITPEEAIEQSARILAAQFTQLFEPVVTEPREDHKPLDPQEAKVMLLTVEELDLPTRISNALRRGGFKTVNDLVTTPRQNIARVKNLGDKSVDIVSEVLATKGIKLMD